jgi:hypothetical protein
MLENEMISLLKILFIFTKIKDERNIEKNKF